VLERFVALLRVPRGAARTAQAAHDLNEAAKTFDFFGHMSPKRMSYSSIICTATIARKRLLPHDSLL
jgi:hypothetical protein